MAFLNRLFSLVTGVILFIETLQGVIEQIVTESELLNNAVSGDRQVL